ncbi:hypothetical protein [Trinickia dinghuensis]|uniref:DNA-binding protein n=1 Tax=Trinickia dinghuensis TaxID=2291023 RepID=A0A3D8JYQ9_9BURK|nr:hypothetical protein [Trinickia dinghuensis]RDU98297.1 hypothetical protein DWV00_13340 [Trinickia dinghuensis]
MKQTALTRAITSDSERSVEQHFGTHHATFRPTHVGTEVAASMLMVEPATLLKSRSIYGHYAGIRPVRLPNRKLAWPIAEIDRLFAVPVDGPEVKEIA